MLTLRTLKRAEVVSGRIRFDAGQRRWGAALGARWPGYRVRCRHNGIEKHDATPFTKRERLHAQSQCNRMALPVA